MRKILLGAVAWTAILTAGGAFADMATPGGMAPSPVQSANPMDNGAMAPARPDAQMQAVIDADKKLGAKPLPSLSVAEAREQPTLADGQKEVLADEHKSIEPEAVASVDHVRVPVADGVEVDARIYTPVGASSDETLPVVVFFHGGGWTIGSLDSDDGTAREIANGAHAVVVSCDYRKGPEYKFPTAHNDALECYQWATKNTGKFNGDPARIAVAGESAGGNMAAEVAIEARDRHMTMPIYQVLIYPVAGGGFEQTSDRIYTDPSLPLNTATIEWMLKQYTSSPADESNPRLAIVNQPDLMGLPPATLITAEIDPLNSEGRAYARKLMAAGVPVDYRNFTGVTHGFFGLGQTVEKAKDAEQMANADLMKAFARQPPQASIEQP
jgi:acetyl esterase/lipase